MLRQRENKYECDPCLPRPVDPHARGHVANRRASMKITSVSGA